MRSLLSLLRKLCLHTRTSSLFLILIFFQSLSFLDLSLNPLNWFFFFLPSSICNLLPYLMFQWSHIYIEPATSIVTTRATASKRIDELFVHSSYRVAIVPDVANSCIAGFIYWILLLAESNKEWMEINPLLLLGLISFLSLSLSIPSFSWQEREREGERQLI